MPLVDEVSAAIADAMRKQESVRLGALRMLKAALMNRGVEKGHDLVSQERKKIVTTTGIGVRRAVTFNLSRYLVKEIEQQFG